VEKTRQSKKALEPGAYQRDVGRAGRQQRDGERELDTLAGGLEDRSHGREHPAILGRESRGFFFPGFMSRLRLRDSRQNGRNGPKRANLPPNSTAKG